MHKIMVMLPVLFLAACGVAGSDSGLQSESQKEPYLALGDSIAFGFSPLVPMNDENVQNGLFVGYPEVVGQRASYAVTNTGCSGETTLSFLDLNGRDNGCHTGSDPRHDHLKVEYSVSQMDFAVDFLAQHPDTKLVTLTVGGNDLLLVEDDCNTSKLALLCKAAKLPGTALSIAKNIGTIADRIHATGYQGPLVFVTGYARNFNDPIQKLALGTVQNEIKVVALLKHFTVASGYDAFKQASADFDGDACKAGLLIDMGDGTCNQHPSQKGREVLAQTVLDAMKR